MGMSPLQRFDFMYLNQDLRTTYWERALRRDRSIDYLDDPEVMAKYGKLVEETREDREARSKARSEQAPLVEQMRKAAEWRARTAPSSLWAKEVGGNFD